MKNFKPVYPRVSYVSLAMKFFLGLSEMTLKNATLDQIWIPFCIIFIVFLLFLL